MSIFWVRKWENFNSFPSFQIQRCVLGSSKKNHGREQCPLEVFCHLTIGNKTSIDFTGVKFPQSREGVGWVCSAVELLYERKCSFPRVLYQYVKADSECCWTLSCSSSVFPAEVYVCIRVSCALWAVEANLVKSIVFQRKRIIKNLKWKSLVKYFWCVCHRFVKSVSYTSVCWT